MTARREWAVVVPRPPSVNEIERMHYLARNRKKKAYVERVRWALRAHPIFVEFPFSTRVRVEVVIRGKFRGPGVRGGGSPDKDNWMKWLGDALKGFAIYDDAPAYWDWDVVFESGAPAAELRIRRLDEAVRPKRPEELARMTRALDPLGRRRG